ncbi:hypothetical protein P152DRAFT_65630 [Eremomyces bilateralis CBS 781.70]|uniref:Ubiquinol-cytochrome c chaperone domain-containing protein n=1 Tax=Eremomyces bilateralis CBS 781.70 TaxID=1392243 RepID=A0A6G1FZB7_9PEZI|nr:uncharacterized protein P152DRAFT_65630 [Eremomyces bilateralis CBS 781.70]KAF1811215.1 hypothetical protein P152DRAFT_65630 [Eremomyces bilateralis CBS 781.70]
MNPSWTCRACLRSVRAQWAPFIPNFQSSSSLLPLTRFNSSQSQAQAQEQTKGSSPNRPSRPTPVQRVAKVLQNRAPAMVETYHAFGATEHLYKECASQAIYNVPQARDKSLGEIPLSKSGKHLGVGEGWWYDELKLEPTFSTWAHVTFLHMYLLTVRFRMFPPEYATTWHQHLTDHFFHDAEAKMEVLHLMTMRGMRNKFLKDLFTQWRGCLVSYDEGLVKGDAALAAAVWRNLFQGEKDVDFVALAQVVSYMRRVIAGLDQLSDGEVIESGLKFGHVDQEKPMVLMKSRLMDSGS